MRAAAASGSVSTPPSTSISAPSTTVSSRVSAGPPPRSTSIDSAISSALPIVPADRRVHVGQHAGHALAGAGADRAHRGAQRRAVSTSFMNAPAPTFTSITRPSMPSASFFDMIDDVISGIDSTVP
jgi:hypothetical protein